MDTQKGSDITLTDQQKKKALQREKLRIAKLRRCDAAQVMIHEDRLEWVYREYQDHLISIEREKKYWNKVTDRGEMVLPTPQQLYHMVIQRAEALIGKPFVLDENNAKSIKLLCLYFTKDPKAKNYGLDIEKGIALMGGVGTGKTTIMKAFSTNPMFSFQVRSARQITFEFAKDGFSVIKHYGQNIRTSENMYRQTTLGLCIDDMGTDSQKKNYGNQVDAIAEVIFDRYELPYNNTHLTTNLNADEIEDVYGLRIRSRMREMFNIVEFNSKDRRK